MGIKLGPHVKRYKDIAMLLMKYGNSDLVKNAGLDDVALEANEPATKDSNGNGKSSLDDGTKCDDNAKFSPAYCEVNDIKSKKMYIEGPRTNVSNAATDPIADTHGAANAETEGDKNTNGDKKAKTKADATADDLANDIEKLGPAFVKFGQLMSTRSDLLPPAYLVALSRLQDKCEPVPFTEIEKRVNSELGVRMSKAFREFDSEPVAAASLAQIHRAVLRDGREVAVKVQRPGIRESILEDLEILTEIADFYDTHTQTGKKYEYGVMLEEFRKSVLAELDYRKEAHNLEVLKKNLEEFSKNIVVPAPIHDYSTSVVLTMDFIRGKKVTDVTRLALLEFDGEPLAEDVFQAYLKQILVDGFFHADPHPGNVFLTDDNKVALLDLGMVARLTPQLQGKLLQLVIAISEGRPDAVANIAVDIGESKDNYDEKSFRSKIGDLVQNDLEANIEGMEVGKVVIGVTKAAGDCGIRVPAELTMVGKALMNLDQIGRSLYPRFDPNASIRRNAAHIMEQRLLKDLSPGHIGNNMLEARDFMEKMPKHINKILDLAAHNKLSMKVIDEPVLIDAFQKVANRISLSLILASLIIGAALITRVPTPYTLFGYPTVAIVCFLAAAIGGFALAVQIAFYDQKPQKLKEHPPRRND